MKLFPQDSPQGLRGQGWQRAGLRVGAQRLPHHLLQGSAPRKANLAPWCPGSTQGFALQIQCYQCEEFQLNNDCSSPEFIVNCTVNVQDMCQKEVMEQSAGGGRCKRKHCLQTHTSAGSQSKASCTASRVHPRQPASSPRPGTNPSAPLGN
nr:ly6/PLAUR domain-containing protein 1 isoform X2 [Mirounga angustirostris]